MHKMLKLAAFNAKNHFFHEKLEYNLCAVIAKAGKPVSIGFNSRSTNAFVEHYANLARGRRDYCLSTHAEMDAVLKARNNTDLRGCKIFVARIKHDGTGLGLARPCQICEQMLFNYGIKRAFYTINENEYGVMRICAPESNTDATFISGSC